METLDTVTDGTSFLPDDGPEHPGTEVQSSPAPEGDDLAARIAARLAARQQQAPAPAASDDLAQRIAARIAARTQPPVQNPASSGDVDFRTGDVAPTSPTPAIPAPTGPAPTIVPPSSASPVPPLTSETDRTYRTALNQAHLHAPPAPPSVPPLTDANDPRYIASLRTAHGHAPAGTPPNGAIATDGHRMMAQPLDGSAPYQVDDTGARVDPARQAAADAARKRASDVAAAVADASTVGKLDKVANDSTRNAFVRGAAAAAAFPMHAVEDPGVLLGDVPKMVVKSAANVGLRLGQEANKLGALGNDATSNDELAAAGVAPVDNRTAAFSAAQLAMTALGPKLAATISGVTEKMVDAALTKLNATPAMASAPGFMQKVLGTLAEMNPTLGKNIGAVAEKLGLGAGIGASYDEADPKRGAVAGALLVAGEHEAEAQKYRAERTQAVRDAAERLFQERKPRVVVPDTPPPSEPDFYTEPTNPLDPEIIERKRLASGELGTRVETPAEPAPESPASPRAVEADAPAADQDLAARIAQRQQARAESTTTTPEAAPEVPEAQPEPARPATVGNGVVPTPPGGVDIVRMPISALHVDPTRFQYKQNTDATTGAGAELAGVKKFNETMAGVISVWRDPADGKVYVVNGHHRRDLAERTGHPSVNVQFLPAATASEARAMGAITNIAEGRGTAIDAATFFRENPEHTPADLQDQVSMKGVVMRHGVNLSKLAPDLFSRVATGQMPTEQGAAIGEMLSDPAQQRVAAQAMAGRRVTPPEAREIARQVRDAGSESVNQDSLFGSEASAQPLFHERAQLATLVKRRLAADKRLFGFVAKGNRAEELARGGNVIDAKRSAEIAGEASQLEEVFNQLYTRSGPVGHALTEAARKVAHGEKPATLVDAIYPAIRDAITTAFGHVGATRDGASAPADSEREPAAGPSWLSAADDQEPASEQVADSHDPGQAAMFERSPGYGRVGHEQLVRQHAQRLVQDARAARPKAEAVLAKKSSLAGYPPDAAVRAPLGDVTVRGHGAKEALADLISGTPIDRFNLSNTERARIEAFLAHHQHAARALDVLEEAERDGDWKGAAEHLGLAAHGPQLVREPSPEDGALSAMQLREWARGIEHRLGLSRFDLHLNAKGDIEADVMTVPRDARNQGRGTAAMQALVDLADRHGRRILLSPADRGDLNDEGTTSRTRLIKFYRRFGFERNAGRGRDFSISATMVREPVRRGVGEESPRYGDDEFDTPTIRAARARQAAMSIVNHDNDPAGLEWRAQQVEKMMAGATRNEKRADIVLGLPGSGKTATATRLATQHGAALLDNDVAKESHPAFEGGLGSDALHPESVKIRTAAIRTLITRGANFVFPTVGHPENTARFVDQLREAGYSVHVHLVDVPNVVAARRAVTRYTEQGKHFIDPQRILGLGDAPRRTYLALESHPGVTAHAPVNNDVPLGSPAKPIPDWRERFAEPGESGNSERADRPDGRSDGRRVDGDDAPANEREARPEGPDRVSERAPAFDLFENEEGTDEPAQDSLFDAKAGTAAARSLKETELAARHEIARLRQQVDLVKDAAHRQAFLARIGQLSMLVNRDQAIGAEELAARLAAIQSTDAPKAPEGQQSLFERSPEYAREIAPFYSRLERSIESAPPRMTVQQWKVRLEKATAKGEREWTGVESLLAGKSPDDKLTRDEVLDTFRRKAIALGTAVRTANTGRVVTSPVEWERSSPRTWIGRVDGSLHFRVNRLEGNGLYRLDSGSGLVSTHPTLEAAQEQGQKYADNMTRKTVGRARYEQYTEPGGENYREMAVTLEGPTAPGNRVASMSRKELNDTYERVVGYRPDDDSARWADSLGDGAAPRELPLEELRSMVAEVASADDPTVFSSAHLEGIANPLLHVRLKDRVLPDGRKVLHVEEIQSDWHQRGRKEGYRPEVKKRLGALDEERAALEAKGRDATEAERIRWAEVMNALTPLRKSNPAPDAPFKKTEEWVALAWKHILDEAVRGGYDAVAWTPGEIQADRFSLHKVVDLITYEPATQELWGGDVVGGTVINETVPPEKLGEYIGKELAERLLASPLAPLGEYAPDHYDAAEGPSVHGISDKDLIVGGGGIKAFYDKIVPSVLRDHTKKIGAPVTVAPLDLHLDANAQSARGPFGVYWDIEGTPANDEQYPTLEDAEEAAQEIRKATGEDVHVRTDATNPPFPAFEVTPALRDAIIQKGQFVYEPSRAHYSRDVAQGDLFGMDAPPPSEAETAFGSQAEYEAARKRWLPLLEALEASKVPTARRRLAEMAAHAREQAQTDNVSLRGVKVSTREDWARIHQLFRDPTVEKFHVYVMGAPGVNGQREVLGHVVWGVGALSYAIVPSVPDLVELVKALGGDAVVFGHNHPSGLAMASRDDIDVTADLMSSLTPHGIPVVGHVIIDHGTFSWIEPNAQSGGLTTHNDLPFDAAPSAYAVGRGAGILNKTVAAEAMRSFASGTGATVMYMDTQYRVLAIDYRDAIDLEHIGEWLSVDLERLGARGVFIGAPRAQAHALAKLATSAHYEKELWPSDIIDMFGTDATPGGSNAVEPLGWDNRYARDLRSTDIGKESASRVLRADVPPATGRRYPDWLSARDEGRLAGVRRGSSGDGSRVAEPPPPSGGPPSAHPMPDPDGLGGRKKGSALELFRSVQRTFNPESLDDNSKATAGTIRSHGAKAWREYARATEALIDFGKAIDKLSRRQLVDYWDKAEQGQSVGNAEHDAGNAALHAVTQHFTDELIRRGLLNAESAIEDYIGRFWSGPAQKKQSFLSTIFGKRPLQGSKSFLKHRSFDRFVEGLDAGLTPATYNYVDAQLAKIAEMQRLITAHDELQYELAQGRAKRVMTSMGQQPPVDANGDAWVRLGDGTDPAFIVYGPKTGAVSLEGNDRLALEQAGIDPAEVEQQTSVYGRRIMGAWYAPKSSAAVWDAHLSRGLKAKPWANAYLVVQRAATQLLLGFGGFHLTVITNEGAISALSQIVDALVNRGTKPDVRGALRSAVQAATAPVSLAMLGRRIRQEFHAPGTHPQLAAILDAMIEGGYRGKKTSEMWEGDRRDVMRRAFNTVMREDESIRRKLKGAGAVLANFAPAVIELASSPILGAYVPYMKAGAAYSLLAQELAKMPPGADVEALRARAGDIMKEMDYRFGQVVYDNHFMNRTAKDIAQMLFLAPGWTFGTAVLGARGIRDIARIPGNVYGAATGRGATRVWVPNPNYGKGGAGSRTKGAWVDVPPELLGKSAIYWLAAAAVLMWVSGTLTYLLTKEHPEGMDYLAYRDGTTDRDGNANRHRIPGYISHDVWSWAHHPGRTLGNKLAPVLTFFWRLYENRTYFGDQIYDPNAPRGTKLRQVGKATVQQFTPIAVQNVLESRKRNDTGPGEVALNAFGVNPAPREMERTPAQNLMDEMLARHHFPRTPDEQASSEGRADVIAGLRDGSLTRADLRRMVREGTMTVSQAVSALTASQTKEDPLIARFKRLSYAEAQAVYAHADEREKKLWRIPLRLKEMSHRMAALP